MSADNKAGLRESDDDAGTSSVKADPTSFCLHYISMLSVCLTIPQMVFCSVVINHSNTLSK